LSATRSISSRTTWRRFRGRRRRGTPQRRGLRRPDGESAPVSASPRDRGRARGEPLEFRLQLLDRPERLVPPPLQGAGHQAVLRLAGVVLPGGSVGLVPRPSGPLLPVPRHLPSPLLDLGRRAEARVQDRRLQRLQDLSGHPGLDLGRRRRLAQRPAVVRPQGAAHVRRPPAGAAVPHVHPLPAPPAPHHPGQQGRPVPDRAGRLRPRTVGRQPRLVRLEAAPT